MKQKSHDLSKYDVSDRARSALNTALSEELSGTSNTAHVPIAEARHGQTQVAIESDRDTTRLLVISQELTLLNQTTQSLDGYVNIADVFDEVHIMVLQQGLPPRNPVLRVASNVWLYVVTSEVAWQLPIRALRTIAEQMIFAEGFRPDLIVARDSYESALVAYVAGRHYTRPTQLHIMDDLLRPVLPPALPPSRFRRFISWYLIPHFASIRVATDSMRSWLLQKYPQIPDVRMLPRFHNYAQLQLQSTARSVKSTYRQFGFVIAYCGVLDSNAKAYQVMDAVRGLLRSPTIGLIFFGDGPARRELEKRAQILGVSSQIAFETDPEAVTQYLASVDVLVVPEDTAAADELVIMGAFAEVPVVATLTTLRSDFFVHGESMLLCGVGDTMMMGTLVNQLVNDRGLRETLRVVAHAIVSERLHEDSDIYRLAYRDSVEAALFIHDTKTADSTDVTTE